MVFAREAGNKWHYTPKLYYIFEIQKSKVLFQRNFLKRELKLFQISQSNNFNLR